MEDYYILETGESWYVVKKGLGFISRYTRKEKAEEAIEELKKKGLFELKEEIKMIFKEKLKNLGACPEAIEWTGEKSEEEAWESCERLDWLLWYIFRTERRTLEQRIDAICRVAEVALEFVPKNEERPKKALEAARKLIKYNTEENRSAVNAAYAAAAAAAYFASNAVYTAYFAASNAVYAAYFAANAAANTSKYANAAYKVKKELEKLLKEFKKEFK